MKGKFKKLFSPKTAEIAGSFDGDASDSLLATSNYNADWDAWSVGNKNEEKPGRGRSNGRTGGSRSQSEVPTARKRSKSEVNKRLKRLQGDMSVGSTRKKKISGSKSAGGVFRGSSSEVRSRIDSLALERAVSDSKSLFKSDSDLMTPRKLRGGRRKSSSVEMARDARDATEGRKEAKAARKRSKSASARGRRTTDDIESSHSRSSSKKKRSSSTKRSTSATPKKRSSSLKPRRPRPSIESADGALTEDSSTTTTKDSKTKKKKKKKEKSKRDNRTLDESSSIPSRVEMDGDEWQSESSNITMQDSIKPKKKKEKIKDKDKSKKKKNTQAAKNGTFPDLPPDDFGDGLEGLAEEFRRSKESYGSKDNLAFDTNGNAPDPNNSSYTKVSNMFEDAWTGMGKSKTEGVSNPFDDDNDDSNGNNKKSQNPFDDDDDGPVGKDTNAIEQNLLQQALEFEVKQAEINNEQQEEILKLQQQLSAALQKQLTMSEEHIAEKNKFMQVSRDLDRVKVELAEAQEERGELMEELKERDRMIEEDRNRISNLEQAIDTQLEKEEELMRTVHHSEEEIEKLLEEIQNFEKKLENGDTGGGGASFVELRNLKKALEDREEEVAAQKSKIEVLEKDLKDSMTVPQMQIDELDQENKALQGRLKGERLEYTSKLVSKDELIKNLQAELTAFTSSPDAQDLQSARQKLTEAREDATQVREDLAATRKLVEELHGEREDMVEKYNLLKDKSGFMEKTVKDLTQKSDSLAKKVLEWTEKTYDWKKKYETTDRKLKELSDENKDKAKSKTDNPEASSTGDMADKQAMFLQGIMDNQKTTGTERRGSTWGGLFNKNASEKEDVSEEQIQIRVLEEKNHEYEAKLAQLNSDLVKMQSGHKEELYTIKKKIAQLEGENDALLLQNAALEKLRND